MGEYVLLKKEGSIVINKWLLDNVKQYLSQGYDLNSMYYTLNPYGYSYQDIKDAVDHIKSPEKKRFELKALHLGTLSPKVQFLVKYLFPALALFILVVGYLLMSDVSPEQPKNLTQLRNLSCQYACCADIDCDDRNATTIDACSYPNNPLAACKHTIPFQQQLLCGDAVCDQGETAQTCCMDCPCSSGECVDNVCEEEARRCIVDSDCEDYTPETRNVCNHEGICVFEQISACIDLDGYCPQNCTALTDNDCQQLCTFDADCNDANISTIDICTGIPKTCKHEVITECNDNDAVCPNGCTTFTDTDCQRDACQKDSDCSLQDQCKQARCIGMPKQCSYEPITQCFAQDHCCPAGCTYPADTDCPQEEECLFDFECEDYNNATRDSCSVQRLCEHASITECILGDNYCPAGCRYPQDTDCPPVDQCRTNLECNDNDLSTEDACSGSPKRCTNIPITECATGDSYCPSTCTYTTDRDCPRGEECTVHADCNDTQTATRDECVGTPKRCVHTEILACVSNDQYCPPGCSGTTDSDCSAQQQPSQPQPSEPQQSSSGSYEQRLEEAYALIGRNGSVDHMITSFSDLTKISQEMNRRCGYYIGYVYSSIVDSTFIYCPRQGLTYAICQGRKIQFSTLFCRGNVN